MSRRSKPEYKTRIVAAINADESIKGVACELGISTGYAYKIAQDLGYLARLVNAKEMKLLKQHRSTKSL
jgi:hypothetical protein